LHHDVELAEGEFAVGRSATCQLSLDDPLVSRRHAVFHVSESHVTIEDLGSRNGVIVNGARVEGTTDLAVGDRVLIGSQELTLLATREGGPSTRSPATKNTVSRMTPSSGVQMPRLEDAEPSMVRRVDQFKLLGSVAEKALALGRAGEAERLLASVLADVIEASRAGRPLPVSLVDQAAKFSARLATSTGKGGWADYVIELYAAQNRPPPAAVIDELYNAMNKVTAVDVGRLRDFVVQIQGRSASLGPADRFLLQRLEGLERRARSLRG
jgi:predicted component of type VI protein secretion system